MRDSWPDRETEWSQQDLHAYVRQMGCNPDPTEIVPQGVKWIAWPQPPLSDAELKRGLELAKEIEVGTIKPLATIRRHRDPRRN